MTTRQEIFDWLISQKLIEKLSTRFSSLLGENLNDWIQEMYLTVFEMPEEKLIRLFDNNQLVYYIISVCKKQALHNKSKFNKIYNDPHITYKENLTYEQEDNQMR